MPFTTSAAVRRSRNRSGPRRVAAGLTALAVTLGMSSLAAPNAGASATPVTATAATTAHTASPAADPAARTLSGGVPHTISYDQYSLKIDGKRTYIYSGEFHYFRLPSPGLWRDVLQKMKAAGFNGVSIYFDWAYHSPAPGVYDFTGVRDVDTLLDIADQVGLYVIARPGPYINAEVDGGGFPAWLGTKPGLDRSADPDYLTYANQWLTHIDAILARHQMTNGTGPIIAYQVENEYYDGSTAGRDYMEKLETKVRSDGITVPLTGNNNGTFNSGRAALDIDGPDSYPQGFNCSNPTQWRPVDNISYDHPNESPLYTPEYQGGAFDPWGGPGYDKCRQLTGADFANVFYKNNIAVGATMQSFYMTYGGTNWGNQAEPAVYTSYDYGAPITEARQLTAKYQQDKLIGYFTHAVAPLTKTDALGVGAPPDDAIVDTARINPDTHTQFHVLRHRDSTATSTDSTHISIDLGASSTYTYDDADTTDLHYEGNWSHVGPEQSYTHGEYQQTESFSDTAGDSVTIPFTGTAIRWIASTAANHGIADVYLDGNKVASVDGYSSGTVNGQVQYTASGLPDTAHTLKIVVTGQRNPASAGTFVSLDAIDLPSGSARVYPSVPQQPGTSITLNGRDSAIIVANYLLGQTRMQYSTSEILTNQTIGDRDVAVLYGADGTDGETVLNYTAKPDVHVLSGDIATTWDAATGDLRLNYTHHALARVLITGGGVRPLLLLIGTDQQAEKFWLAADSAGPVLVYGTDLLRSAELSRGTLELTGDSDDAQQIEVFASDASRYTWNGNRLATAPTPSGSRLGEIGGPQPVQLPALTHWKRMQGSPESQPAFDDSSWQVADKMTSNSTTTPVTLPVLFQDDYGFHYGDVWYRGHFDATTASTGITLSAITGTAGNYQVWLNGTYLGHSDDATHTFAFPAGVVNVDSDNEVSVLVDTSGHNEDYNVQNTNKEARGLTGATVAGSPLATITWRIQGTRGGEQGLDPVRGPLNTGGLYGERAGWTLPGFPENHWQNVTLPTTDTTPGVSWYRTTVNLNLPKDQDTSVGLRISDDPSRAYRAFIYVNGWQLGKYINNIGPQHEFVIPTGILNPDGRNTIAIAVTNEDGSTGGLGTVSLFSYGSPVSSLRVPPVSSPGYDATTYRMPAPHHASLTAHVPGSMSPGSTATVSATFSTDSGAGAGAARDVRLHLTIPDGWTATPTTPTSASHPVPPGHSFTASWTVTAPDSLPTISELAVVADYQQGEPGRHGAQQLTTVRDIRALPTPPTGNVEVSALPFFSASNGWGPVERDMSNGETAAGDGSTITLNGQQFAHGLGTNSPSDVALYLGGQCTRFQATVGVDDEVGNSGSVTFSVVADGKPLSTTPVLYGSSDPYPMDVDISGAQMVDLVVGEGGDGNGHDHGDWADARLTCSS